MDLGTFVLGFGVAVVAFLFVLRPGYEALESWFDRRRLRTQRWQLDHPSES